MAVWICQYYCIVLTWATIWDPIDLDAPLLVCFSLVYFRSYLLALALCQLFSFSMRKTELQLSALSFLSHFPQKKRLSESSTKTLNQSTNLRTRQGQVHNEVTQELLQS